MRLAPFAVVALLSFAACTNETGLAQPENSGNESEKKESSKQDTDNSELDCSKLESTGRELGDVAPDLVLEDGAGNKVHLHDFCNETVILIASEH